MLLELSRGSFGVGLEGGLEASRSLRRPEGQIWAAQRWLALYGRFDIALTPRLTLVTTLGIRGWQIEAGASGFSNLRPTTLYSPGAALTLGAEIELGPVMLLVRGIAAVRFREERLMIYGFGPTLLLKWWQVGALAGLGWHFP